MKTTTTTIAAIVATLFYGAAVAAEGEKADFQKLDANSDGVVTTDEAQAKPELMEAWATLDENADGALDEEEFANFKRDSNMSGSDTTGSDATGSDATGSDVTGSDASGSDASGSGQSEVGDSDSGEQEGYTSEPKTQDADG